MPTNDTIGFDFGPKLGIVGTPGQRPPQARVVRHVSYYGSNTNPLQGGHFIEWTGGDPPDSGGGDPWIPGGDGLGGGVLRGNDPYNPGIETTPPKKGPYEPYQWGKCRFPDGKIRDCCTNVYKDLVREAYKKILGLPCLQSTLFPGLLALLTERYKTHAIIQCMDRSTCVAPDGTLYASHWADTGELILCSDVFEHALDSNSPGYDSNVVAAKLLHELIHACGGNEIDTIAIVMACFPGSAYDLIEFYQREIDTYCTELLSDNTTKVVYGKYTVWDPATGQVSALSQPGLTNEANIGNVLFVKRGPDWRRTPKYVRDMQLRPCSP